MTVRSELDGGLADAGAQPGEGDDEGGEGDDEGKPNDDPLVGEVLVEGWWLQ